MSRNLEDVGLSLVVVIALVSLGQHVQQVRLDLQNRERRRVTYVYVLQETHLRTGVSAMDKFDKDLLSHASREVRRLYRQWRVTARERDRDRLRTAVFAGLTRLEEV